MRQPLISVVLPVYNREEFVEDAIKSILNQTFSDFELIVIDDASTDSTISKVKKIKDSRIKIVLQDQNTGVASAINKGLNMANGKYIARMDSDDLAVTDRFEKQLQVLESDTGIIVCGSCIQLLNSERTLEFPEYHEHIRVEMLRRCALSMGTSMFNLKKLKGFFLQEGLRYGEDYEFWSRIIEKGGFYNLQEPLLLYRSHENQLSKLYKPQQIAMDAEIRLIFFKKLNYDEVKFPDELIKRVLVFDQYISVEEFALFLKWLNTVQVINNETKLYSSEEFHNIIFSIRQNLLFNIFFKKSKIGIDKNWRKKAITKMGANDFINITKAKLKERFRFYTR